MSPWDFKAQAKVHKPVINNCLSFRSILFIIYRPSFKLAKFLVLTLPPFTIEEYIAKDSFAFAKEITMTDCNYFVTRLDVVSLFNKIFLLIYL